MRATAFAATTRLALGSSAVVLVACSSPGASQARVDVDAAVAETRSAVALVDAHVRRSLGTRRDWRQAGRGFAIDAGARDLPSVRASFLSRRGDQLEISHAGRRMVVRDASIVGRVGRVDDGRVVFDAIGASPDVVWTADATRVESFHVLRAPMSHAEITWTLELPAGSRGLADDHRGGVDVLDEVGEPLFHVPRPYAIDANGVRRDAKLTFEGATVRVELDQSGLALPVLLDPAVEAAVWQLKSASNTPAFVSMTVTSTSSGPILTGYGSGTSECDLVAKYASTYRWDGSQWNATYGAPTLRSIVGPWSTGALAYGTENVFTGAGGGTCYDWSDTAYTQFWSTSGWTKSSAPRVFGCYYGSGFLAYDAKRSRAVLACNVSTSYGGFQTLTAEFDGGAWTQPLPINNSATLWAGAIYDAGRQKVVALTSNNQLQEWTGTAWTALTTAPSSGLLTYDSQRKRLLVVGASSIAEFDGASWTSMLASGPSISSIAFDPLSKRVIAVRASETWLLYVRGNTCTTASDCDTGYCVDGVCCEQSSCGSCQACNTAAAPGQCGPVANAEDADTCTGTKFCDATGACKVKAGQTCGAASQCLSGFCVDGVCCDSACTGRCQTCLGSFKASGADGACGPVKDGADPDGECPDDGAPSCKRDGFCDGIGACRNYAKGVSCGATSCTGTKVTGNTCDGLGICASDATGTDCAPFACSAGKCATSCTTNAECAPGSWCSGGACTSQLAQGDACTLGASCPSGQCVDGACCDTACTGQCEACDVAGVVGVCTPVAGAPHRSRAPCSDGGGDVCKVRECDGVAGHGGSCQGYKNGITTACGSASCANAKYTPAPTCDGAGACPAAHETSCVPYACDDTGCKKSCATAADCADKYTCNAGKCEAITTTCSDDGLSEIAADKTTHTCAPYLCKNQQCRTRCADGTDCAPGNRCNEDGACVPSDAGGAADSGGCGVANGRAPSPALGGLAALALLALAARRRRSGRQTS